MDTPSLVIVGGAPLLLEHHVPAVLQGPEKYVVHHVLGLGAESSSRKYLASDPGQVLKVVRVETLKPIQQGRRLPGGSLRTARRQRVLPRSAGRRSPVACYGILRDRIVHSLRDLFALRRPNFTEEHDDEARQKEDRPCSGQRNRD
jgi:hypothetical protein